MCQVNAARAVISGARAAGVGTVVLTSSTGSTNKPGAAPDAVKSELTAWSDPEQQKAAGKFSPAAKTLMEQTALQMVGRGLENEVTDAAAAEGAPRLCIINPSLILGPQLQPGPVSGNSLPWFSRICKGEVCLHNTPSL